MTKQEALDFIRTHPEQYLKRDGTGKGYICPKCGSGSGSHGTGMTTQDGRHFTCWAGGCFKSCDIIDIIGQQTGARNFPEALAAAAKEYGITIDGQSSGYTAPKRTPAKEAPPEDLKSFFLEANKHLTETDYHRGISLETLNRFSVGYCPKWKHPKAPESAPATARLIIPTGPQSYLARATEKVPKQYEKQKAGETCTFNLKAIYQEKKPVFVVEGEIDALSIIDNGGEAIATGTTARAGALIEEIKAAKAEGKPVAMLILALDNDKAGKSATETLKTGLKALEVPHSTITLPDGIKDANEYLSTDKEGFRRFILQAEEQAQKAGEEQQADAAKLKEDERAQLEAESAAAYCGEFMRQIKNKAFHESIKTGFPVLDNALEGGLFPGLSVIGAVSSLGKTTFALQIADNIARQGRSVLFFSLEMGRAELIAKSLSRITFESGAKVAYAKTTRKILSGKLFADALKGEPGELDTINGAIDEYFAQIAKNLYIIEGTGDIGAEDIADKVKRHKEAFGRAPVVIVDYLQILKPESDRLTDKQATDRAVLTLKRLSRDFDTQVICISSFNRDNYNEPVNMRSFKESGAVEYGSDYCIGLQYAGMDYQSGEKEQARLQRIYSLIHENTEKAKKGASQQIEVKILKNRNGRRDTVTLDFWPMFNTFRERKNTETEYKSGPRII